jgi:hypothetical protein
VCFFEGVPGYYLLNRAEPTPMTPIIQHEERNACVRVSQF